MFELLHEGRSCTYDLACVGFLAAQFSVCRFNFCWSPLCFACDCPHLDCVCLSSFPTCLLNWYVGLGLSSFTCKSFAFSACWVAFKPKFLASSFSSEGFNVVKRKCIIKHMSLQRSPNWLVTDSDSENDTDSSEQEQDGLAVVCTIILGEPLPSGLRKWRLSLDQSDRWAMTT